jgi:hypothetical protein
VTRSEAITRGLRSRGLRLRVGREYYGPAFYSDFEQIFCVDRAHSFRAGDTWEQHDRMAKRLDERFAEWKARRPKITWWERLRSKFTSSH